MPWRLQPAGFLIAESTGMTSWEHGVLAVIEPGLRLLSRPLDRTINRLGGGEVSGRSGGRVRRLRCCALDQTGGVSKVLGCSSQCAPPRICPLLLSGLEERRSSLYLGGRVSSTKYRRQAVHGAVKALLPPLISSVFNITVCFGSMRGRLSKKTPYETNPFIQVVVFFSCFLCVKLFGTAPEVIVPLSF